MGSPNTTNCWNQKKEKKRKDVSSHRGGYSPMGLVSPGLAPRTATIGLGHIASAQSGVAVVESMF